MENGTACILVTYIFVRQAASGYLQKMPFPFFLERLVLFTWYRIFMILSHT